MALVCVQILRHVSASRPISMTYLHLNIKIISITYIKRKLMLSGLPLRVQRLLMIQDWYIHISKRWQVRSQTYTCIDNLFTNTIYCSGWRVITVEEPCHRKMTSLAETSEGRDGGAPIDYSGRAALKREQCNVLDN